MPFGNFEPSTSELKHDFDGTATIEVSTSHSVAHQKWRGNKSILEEFDRYACGPAADFFITDSFQKITGNSLR